jgi:glycosyltransferase involved in cell wall biosynthesis
MMTSWPLDEGSLPPGVTLHRGITSHTDAWRALWHAADVFVLPTRDEAFGIVFQEAAAAGLPAIGSRLNGVPEIVQHGETGLLCLPGDHTGLARALDTLLASSALRRDMGTRARAFITRVADPDRYCAGLADAIRRVAGAAGH